jgi:flagellar biosynthetic protein FliR
MSNWTAILAHLPLAMLVMFRIGGIMVYGPIFGSSVVPVRVRVFLALVLGAAVYPLLSATCIHPEQLHFSLWMLAPMIAMEIAVGLVIGYVANLPMQALQTGGVIVGQQMGLGFAQLYNPAVDDEADILGQVLIFLAVAAFLMMGGLDMVLAAVLHSFEHIPLGGITFSTDVLQLIAGLLISSLEFALRIASPLLGLVFLETVVMGFLSKTVPQLNVLSLGFPLRILVGLTVLAAGIAVIHDVTLEHIQQVFDALTAWLQGFGT